MDTSKFKSVTISIETWKMLHELAKAEMRSVSRTIEYLVNKYKQEQEKDHGQNEKHAHGNGRGC